MVLWVGVWFHSFKTDREPGLPDLLISLTVDRREAQQILHLTCRALGKMVRALLIAAFLTLNLTCAEALSDMSICYILDAILILYGIILTVLYCRLRMRPANKPEKPPAEGGIYAGLTSSSTDTYETIRMDKKPPIM